MKLPRWPSLGLILCLGVVPLRAQSDSALPPGAPLLPESALPAYEKDLDHAALIRGANPAALARGGEIYRQVCQSCHGDLQGPGSLPTALRFGSGKFQHGNDPHTLYRTLTRGWRLMAPQADLVPQEKYDVIHYLRETFLRPHNPGEYFEVTDAYLAGLPRGKGRGPAPVKREPWREMDYGNLLIGTFEVMASARAAVKPPAGSLPDYVAPGANLAYKAIALRLDAGAGGIARGRVWAAFEHDTLRLAGAWSGSGFIDWHGINFDGRHVVRPRTVGPLAVETADGPGWADPATGDFSDPRVRGADGRRFGPLPRAWARYRGLYRDGPRTVIAFDVGDAPILESYDLAAETAATVVRTLNIGRSSRDLAFRAANAGAAFALVGGGTAVRRSTEDGFEVVRIPAAATPLNLALVYGELPAGAPVAARDLRAHTRGGPAQWPDVLAAPVRRGSEDGPFAVDHLTTPLRATNPWKSWMRLGGHDFLPGTDAAVVCTWDGEVWRVDGLGGAGPLAWRRIAAGLFQPLGVKVVDGAVFVTCRDQLVRLRDLNGDGEADFYECFNSDHQVTEHFHEFAMGLQADAAGNFYYAKSARHARTALVPHHGTLLRVSADGARTDILANGFRAANGVCLNPDGSLIVTDQEGHWMPMNRINWVKPDAVRFYGNLWSHGAPADRSDAAMEPPLTWVDKQFDRSPAELLWVESPAWGTLHGRLLNLSYGTGRIEVVAHESVGGLRQGGLVALPVPEFPMGAMRGRFRAADGHLYLSGLSAWATNRTAEPGGFYRLRATGKAPVVPVEVHARRGAFELVFAAPLDPAAAAVPANFKVTTWSLVRSEKYGSPRTDVKPLALESVQVGADARSLRLALPELAPTHQIEITYTLRGADGAPVHGTYLGTIHALGAAAP